MESLHALLVLLSRYPTETVALASISWILGSCLINAVLTLVPPDKLVAKLESKRAGAIAVRAVRDAGVNPEAAIRFVQALFAARAARQAAALLPAGGGE